MDGLGLVLLVPLLFAVAFVVAVTLTAVSRARGRRRRGAALLAWGGDRGWALVPGDPAARQVPCPPMEAGGSAHLVARGPAPDGAPTLVVEWSRWVHISGGGDVGSSSQREIRSVVAVSPLPGPPRGTGGSAEIVPFSAAGGRRAQRRARDRAVATGHRGFDERYLLRADGSAAVPPALVAWLGELPRVPDLGLRVTGGHLVCWGPGRLTVPRLEDLLGFSCAVRAHGR